MKKYLFYAFIISFYLPYCDSVWSQTAGSGDAVETMASGTINWTVGEVRASGIGAPPAFPGSAAQARAMAERAAYVVALRNLLETVKGVRVDSETVVENYIVKNDVIKAKVDGIVRGARIVDTRYMSDGSVEVLVAMPMKGAFLDALVPESFGRPPAGHVIQKPAPISPAPLPAIPPTPPATPPVAPEKKMEPAKPEPIMPAPPAPETKTEPLKPSPPSQLPEKKIEPAKPEPVQPVPAPQGQATVAFKGGVATGLVIDGRGLGLRPALLPRIVDPQGQEIYVGQVVTRTNAVEQGVAGYAKDVNAATNNFRVTDNPAVIKGLSASGAARTDVVIGQADSQVLRQMSGKGDFLQYCRVIIVY
ncbi:MAG TPA: LPP20 family lipoprotein [Nitrospirota bacterium]|nr:LPP20 family lipoprotein [Nitrospirota bacterium]